MRILLAADGSEYSDQAAAFCGEFVSGFKETEAATVKIITVSDYIVDFESEYYVSEEEFEDLLEQEIYKRCSQILRCAENIIRYKNSHVRIETEIIVGSAKKMIVKAAEKWNADLI